ncbi:PIN domain-containing protein [Planktothrix tepida]|uniref:PIN domain-containing protein n=1 Tax=Planktothrix tepida PCC 9214 TaxID=671072 RepID=A0A1J1LLI2_9CYAN|nr:PIN domain-containing protein [Planktothrix tepida]CAD5937468.1 PIN domain-containing protein [Planktothrix tepida]CUR33335.1 PIN domain-containing protein [Planktothrix tepida PCC 9214]
MRLIFLDAGPLGMIANPKATPSNLGCQLWLDNLLAQGEKVILPEIADYEIRRELLRANKQQSIRKLDRLKSILDYTPINTEVMLLAAELWADARKSGNPTADNRALDADVILAAQAKLEELNGNSVIVVTTNKKHLSIFVDAREWQEIPQQSDSP